MHVAALLVLLLRGRRKVVFGELSIPERWGAGVTLRSGASHPPKGSSDCCSVGSSVGGEKSEGCLLLTHPSQLFQVGFNLFQAF